MTNERANPGDRVDELMTGSWVLAALASAPDDPLPDEHGAVLGAAGMAERGPDGWRLLPPYRSFLSRQPTDFGSRIAQLLRQAADAAEGRAEPEVSDDAVLLTHGNASGEDFARVLDTLTTHLPDFAELLQRDDVRFLDVGIGVGGIAATVLAHAPGASVVGLDVDPTMVRLAEQNLRGQHIADRVELRLRDVVALTDEDTFDLAWLPLTAIAPAASARALPRLRRALRPGGWLVSATAFHEAPPAGTPAPRDAVARWRLTNSGGTLWDANELERRLVAAGYRDIRRTSVHPRGMAIMTARTPGWDTAS